MLRQIEYELTDRFVNPVTLKSIEAVFKKIDAVSMDRFLEVVSTLEYFFNTEVMEFAKEIKLSGNSREFIDKLMRPSDNGFKLFNSFSFKDNGTSQEAWTDGDSILLRIDGSKKYEKALDFLKEIVK
jgi:hypothetical protein